MNELRKIKDDELLKNLDLLVFRHAQSTAQIIAHLAEIDRRRLYAREGYSSLFDYCVKKFNFSEGETFRRIQAARLSRKFPEIIGMLGTGEMNLTTLNLISPYLNPENREILLKKSRRKSKREVEKIVAGLFPKEDEILDKIRKLPVISSVQLNVQSEERNVKAETAQIFGYASVGSIEKRRLESIKPMTARDVKIEFRASEKLAQKIERAKELLRHQYPKVRLEDIFNEALELLLEKRDPERKIARMSSKLFRRKSAQPNPKPECKPLTRYVSQDVRREVYLRDGGQCNYQSPDGRKCGERAFLEIDHARPFALGGKSTAENLQLLCKTHNQYRARQTFGLFRC